jgi:hypothetical protein
MNMDSRHEPSGLKTWALVAAMLGLVFFQGWLAFTVIGDLGQPDWDYRPVPDVPGESPYALYAPAPHPQHVAGEPGGEAYPIKVLGIRGVE